MSASDCSTPSYRRSTDEFQFKHKAVQSKNLPALRDGGQVRSHCALGGQFSVRVYNRCSEHVESETTMIDPTSRYHLFTVCTSLPEIGISAYRGSYATLEDAKSAVTSTERTPFHRFVHIPQGDDDELCVQILALTETGDLGLAYQWTFRLERKNIYVD